MVAVEIVLILVGVAFLVGSHFVQEKFSEKELQEISKMSETELNIVVEKQVKSARTQVENSVEEIIDESLEITKRGLEKETNAKIMAVSEYSDTIMETMNKTHNEIMFLYSMLNDKHAEMTEFAGTLQKYSKQQIQPVVEEEVVAETEATTNKKASATTAAKKKKATTSSKKKNAVEEEKVLPVEAETEDESLGNKNEQILLLRKEGKTEVEIAKALDCGLGEVRLVLGLYKDE